MVKSEEIQADLEEDSREADLSSECSTTVSTRAEKTFHKVSKHDTLAGLAIKYGVTVFDIKKANGLLSDGAMFAMETLIIPLHGNTREPCANRETLARFVGGLGKSDIERGWTSKPPITGPSPSSDAIGTLVNDGFFSVPKGSKSNQEIELREHVGYAGSQSGVEDSILPERVRRRRRDDGDTDSEAKELTDGTGNPGRPPIAPGRIKDYSLLSSSAPSNSDGTLLGFFKGWSPNGQGESFFEKIKRVANSPALAGPPGGTTMFGSVSWPESASIFGMQRGSDNVVGRQGSFSSVGSGIPKACPKTD